MSTDENTQVKKPSTISDKTLEFLADHVVKIPFVPENERLAILTDEQKQQLQEIEDRVIRSGGIIDEVESAIGMLRVGHHFGWKVLYIVHSKKTIRKYEEILGVRIRDIFPEKGPSAPRSLGLKVAETFSNFWKVVSGDKHYKIDPEDRKKIVQLDTD